MEACKEVVCLIALHRGYMPTIVFHDYGGTIIILAWLFLFWHFSTSHVLKPVQEEAEG